MAAFITEFEEQQAEESDWRLMNEQNVGNMVGKECRARKSLGGGL